MLGGGFNDLVNNSSYDNTCAIRLSVTCNKSGLEIPRDWGVRDGNHKDKNGKSIIIRVKTVYDYIKLNSVSHFGGTDKLIIEFVLIL